MEKMILSPRKKCPYSVLFWSAFFPHFPTFGLNVERYRLSLRIQSEYQKMRENGHFLRSVYIFPGRFILHYDKVLYRILKISYLVLFSLLLSLLTDFVFVTDHALGRCLNIHIRAPIKLVVSVLEFCRKCILILLMF